MQCNTKKQNNTSICIRCFILNLVTILHSKAINTILRVLQLIGTEKKKGLKHYADQLGWAEHSTAIAEIPYIYIYKSGIKVHNRSTKIY